MTKNLLKINLSLYTMKTLGVLQSKCIKYIVEPEILNDLLPLRQADQYNLRNRSEFIIPNVKTVNHGLKV